MLTKFSSQGVVVRCTLRGHDGRSVNLSPQRTLHAMLFARFPRVHTRGTLRLVYSRKSAPLLPPRRAARRPSCPRNIRDDNRMTLVQLSQRGRETIRIPIKKCLILCYVRSPLSVRTVFSFLICINVPYPKGALKMDSGTKSIRDIRW